jgi:hypothetical protein
MTLVAYMIILALTVDMFITVLGRPRKYNETLNISYLDDHNEGFTVNTT